MSEEINLRQQFLDHKEKLSRLHPSTYEQAQRDYDKDLFVEFVESNFRSLQAESARIEAQRLGFLEPDSE